MKYLNGTDEEDSVNIVLEGRKPLGVEFAISISTLVTEVLRVSELAGLEIRISSALSNAKLNKCQSQRQNDKESMITFLSPLNEKATLIPEVSRVLLWPWFLCCSMALRALTTSAVEVIAGMSCFKPFLNPAASLI